MARLVADAAAVMNLDPSTVALTRHAGYVHDLGRIGVSNQIWSAPRQLTPSEFERVRLHSYFTVRILRQVRGLERVAQVAGNHHERVDGSGYPRGLAGAALGLPDRLLAAAVRYQAACEPRPYRAELSPKRRNTACAKTSKPAALMGSLSTPSCTQPAGVPSNPVRGRAD
ncbi:HD domain protein [Mycobacterium xenopi 4042]|uniref:HD domain protein n=1 Tax=Mycobacterium xenopi 4042 TaxID=1299334 RepID=X8DCF0_MYCXE|nr:HD domain protein [Mycobacterium xenopi 4042]